MGRYFITPEQLWSAVGGDDAPRIVDVRRRQAFEADDRVLPGALWRDHLKPGRSDDDIEPGDDVVVYCVHGHNVSQLAAASFRARGVSARVLRGGIEAWQEAGLPIRRRSGLPMLPDEGGSRWVTRRRPKVDRIACPWLIRRFIDPDATFLFVEPDQVFAVAEELGGIAFDIDGAPITHQGELCSFDTLLARSGIDDPALAELATIIRGADTARPGLAPEAAGLLALSIGISALAGEDDHLALERGMAVYDALYAWRRKAPNETHNWPGGRA
jgi:rhodanese-related sulfurtransferase